MRRERVTHDESGYLSNGDIEMLRFSADGSGPALGLLLLHVDAEREFAYVAGAETSIELAHM